MLINFRAPPSIHARQLDFKSLNSVRQQIMYTSLILVVFTSID